MTTPIQRRFNVTNLIQDQVAPTQSLNVPAIVTTVDEFGGDRYKFITPDSWETDLTTDTTAAYKWAQTLFSQELTVPTALVIYWNKALPETLAAAIDDAVNTGAYFYGICFDGVTAADVTDQLALSTYVQSFEENVQAWLVTTDTNALSAVDTTHIAAQAKAVTNNRTYCISMPASLAAQRPDAAILGRKLAELTEGASQWDYTALVGVSDSAYTASEQTQLKTNGYNIVEQFTNTSFVHLYNGRSVTGREARIQWGSDWLETNIEASLATYAFTTPLMAFDDETFAAAENIFREWNQRALDRRIINSFEVTLPDPDSFSAAQRATGTATIANAWSAELNSAIDDWSVTGTWTVGGA